MVANDGYVDGFSSLAGLEGKAAFGGFIFLVCFGGLLGGGVVDCYGSVGGGVEGDFEVSGFVGVAFGYVAVGDGDIRRDGGGVEGDGYVVKTRVRCCLVWEAMAFFDSETLVRGSLHLTTNFF